MKISCFQTLQLHRSKPWLFTNKQSETDTYRHSTVAMSFASKDHGTEIRCQFHQHFMSSFCTDNLWPKKSSSTVTREKLRKALTYKKMQARNVGEIDPLTYNLSQIIHLEVCLSDSNLSSSYSIGIL